MTVPYSEATSGANARDEITRVLRRFRCEQIGFMDDFEVHAVTLAFSHRGRAIQIKASAKGWAELYIRENPWTPRRKGTMTEYKMKALRQGLIAVNSILRDWIKGQVTAVECGILSFEAVFMPYMLTTDGRTMAEAMQQARLVPPEADAPQLPRGP